MAKNSLCYESLEEIVQTISKKTIPQHEDEEQEIDNNPHALPFKVMGTCFSSERQDALEKSYETLYEYNRQVLLNFVLNQRMKMILIQFLFKLIMMKIRRTLVL